MKRLLFFITCFLAVSFAFSQGYTRQDNPEYEIAESESKFNIGLGIGLDYGGIGGRITFTPIKQVGIFAGVGYPLVDFGYNVGAQGRFLPDGRVCPTFAVMYGYNGVIKVQGASQYDKIYYGVSISGGIELHFGGRANFMNIELVVPFRSQAFHDDWDSLKNNSSIDIQSEPLPVAISIGYHFAFK
jgi:hypothetical protein